MGDGFACALNDDPSIIKQMWFGLVIIVGMWLSWPLSLVETLVFIFAFMLIIAAELLNTALEMALDHLHPQFHTSIGKSKDVASCFVGVTKIFGWVVIIAFVVRNICRRFTRK